MLISSKNILTETSRTMFDPISRHHGLAKLTELSSTGPLGDPLGTLYCGIGGNRQTGKWKVAFDLCFDRTVVRAAAR